MPGPYTRLSEHSRRRAVSRELGFAVWQRGYWDRIIRSEAEWQELNTYIEANPARWPL